MTTPDATVTICGNLTADPELRYTQGGNAVAAFTIAHTPRIQRDGQWTDGEPVFLQAELWREPAEHLVESLTKGSRVVATGVLRLDQWQDRNTGENRQRMKLVVTELGASLRYATATVHKAARSKPAQDGPPPVDPRTGEVATATERPNDDPNLTPPSTTTTED